MERQFIMLPIEPLESRYSIQWYEWFAKEVSKSKYMLRIINPEPLTKKIENGAFLDICGTNYYKAKQLQELCERIHYGHVKDGDIIFLHDGWFPGVEMLAYIRNAMRINFKIVGCFHAGTYDDTDFISKMGMGKWGEHLENSWFRIFDKIFVATHYHKNLIKENRDIKNWRLIDVTGFPIEKPNEAKGNFTKENIVVFPHRLTSDKQPHLFDDMASFCKDKFPDWQFIKTQEHNLSKSMYYSLLCRSKIAVSFAQHENWGIGMQEAVMCGCIPIVPNRLSYVEMYPEIFRYDFFSQALGALTNFMTNGSGVVASQVEDLSNSFQASGRNAIPKMLEILNDL